MTTWKGGAIVVGVALAGAAAGVGTGASPVAGQGVYVERRAPAWLGIGYEVRWAQRQGQCEARVVVESVVHGSPAERSGLRAGDAILAIDGQAAPAARLQALAGRLVPGDSVRLRFNRGGAVREVTAVADRRPDRPPAVMVREARGLDASTAPIVELRGDTLIARNLPAAGEWNRRARGYWLADASGGAEYRRLSRWSRSDLDERVEELFLCADSSGWTAAPSAPRVDLRHVQQRADSLRIVYARRALEREGEATVTARLRSLEALSPDDTPLQAAIELSGPGTFIYRFEDQLEVGLRGVGGAELTPLEPELAEYFPRARQGLLVLRVGPGTPADRAGLRPGDIVVSASGLTLDSVAELRQLLSLPDAGPLELRIVRKGRTRTLTLRRD